MSSCRECDFEIHVKWSAAQVLLVTYIYIYIYIYIAETWCLKTKTAAKLNSTEMDFRRRSARISRKDKIRNTIIKQKMNVTRSLLDDIKTKLQWYGHFEEWKREDCQKKL